MLLLMLLAVLATAAESSPVTISNTIARSDTAGRLMDVHDGLIKQWVPGGLCQCYASGLFSTATTFPPMSIADVIAAHVLTPH